MFNKLDDIVTTKVGQYGPTFDTGIFIFNPTDKLASGSLSVRLQGGQGGRVIPYDNLEPYTLYPVMLSTLIADDPRFNDKNTCVLSVNGDIKASVIWHNKQLGTWFAGNTLVPVDDFTRLANYDFNKRDDSNEPWIKINPVSSWYWEDFSNGDTDGAMWGQFRTHEAWKLFCKWWVLNEKINHANEPGDPRVFIADFGGMWRGKNPSGHPEGTHSDGLNWDMLYFTNHEFSNKTQGYGRLRPDTESRVEKYPLVKMWNGYNESLGTIQVPRNLRFMLAIHEIFPQTLIFIRDVTMAHLVSEAKKYGMDGNAINRTLWEYTSKDFTPEWNHHIHYHLGFRRKNAGAPFFDFPKLQEWMKKLEKQISDRGIDMFDCRVVQCSNDFDTGIFMTNNTSTPVNAELILRKGIIEVRHPVTIPPYEIIGFMASSIKANLPDNKKSDTYLVTVKGCNAEASWCNAGTSNFFNGFQIPREG